MKKILALLMLACLALTACAGTPTPDVEATVQAALAATQAAQPTDTPTPEPTDTPEPTATSTPTDTPVPTDTPEPTDTPTPEPTDTPEPTATSTPTPQPQPTSTPVPSPTSQPAAAPPPSGEAVSLNILCNCQEQVQADQPVELTYAWLTVKPEQAADYVRLTHGQLTLDGQTVGDVDQYWGEVMEDPDGYKVRWRYPLGTLPAGTHRVELTVSADSAISDGFDSNGDGQADVFGPGEMFYGYVDILVGAAPPAPEPPPSPPSGFEIPPGKALFVFTNYTDLDWNVDIIGSTSYFLAVPPNQPGQEYARETIAIDPGTYIWKAGSPLGYYIRDGQGNTDFQFTVGAGEIHNASVR